VVGCYATTVVVGLTAQNTTGVRQRLDVPLDMVSAQFAAVMDDFPVSAVKVGATWSVELVELIGTLLAGSEVPVVIDPVMVTAAGGRLTDDNAAIRQAVVDRLFPVADVVTPNLFEAEVLADVAAGATDHRTLAERLVGLGARAVLVSAGGRAAGDWFFDGDRHMPVSSDWHHNSADHGAGCAHSSVLTGLLGRGVPLVEAVVDAHRRVAAGVSAGLTHLGSGAHPVDMIGLIPTTLGRMR